MKILVTGGAGYLGSVLVRQLLEAGHEVRVLDMFRHQNRKALAEVSSERRFQLVVGDLCLPGIARDAVEDQEAVVHLAAIVGDPACVRDPDLTRKVNLEGGLQLFHAAREAKVRRFLFASTCSNYGKMKNDFVDEQSILSPISLYAETKVTFEKFLLDRKNQDGLCVTPLRFATLFGLSPRMRFDLTVNEFTLELVTKKRLVVFGETFWRPYLHVADAARAIAIVLEAPEEKVSGEVFNVGSTLQNYRKLDLVEMLRPLAPDAAVEFVHKDEDPRDYRVSFDKIRKTLGFETRVGVEEGICEIHDYIRQNRSLDFSAPLYRN